MSRYRKRDRIQILYASQTGTAETEANLLALQLRERGLEADIASCDGYDIENLPEISYCLFMISTTGKMIILEDSRQLDL